MEFDLRRYWGLSLVDIYNNEITLRQYRAFVKNLPPDSALSRALLPLSKKVDIEELPEHAWSNTEWLLAGISDKLENLFQIQIDPKSRSKDGYLPRPGTRANKPRGASAWFRGMMGMR